LRKVAARAAAAAILFFRFGANPMISGCKGDTLGMAAAAAAAIGAGATAAGLSFLIGLGLGFMGENKSAIFSYLFHTILC
jgi:hypothetical protein